jgi:hypothetical protein
MIGVVSCVMMVKLGAVNIYLPNLVVLTVVCFPVLWGNPK